MVESTVQKNNEVQRPLRERWGMVLLVTLLLGANAVFILAMNWRDSLKVQRVVVEGVNTVSAKEIVNIAQVSSHALMYAVNLAQVQDRILHHPFIKSVAVYRQLPNKLNIDLVEREPVASINCGQLCYVDNDGMLLPCGESNKKFDLPLVSGIDGVQNARLGKTVMSKELFEAIEICRTAEALDTAVHHMISEINMNNGGDIILYAAEAGVPVIIGRGDVARKLLLLENFWMNTVGSTDVEGIQYIDLRFEDQVVVKRARQSERQLNKVSS